MRVPALRGAAAHQSARRLPLHHERLSLEGPSHEEEEEEEEEEERGENRSSWRPDKACRDEASGSNPHRYQNRSLWVSNKYENPLRVAILHDDASHRFPPYHAERERKPSFDEIQAFCQQGKLDRALQALSRMDQLCPTNNLYLSLLKACNQRKALSQAKQVHAHLVQHKSKLSGVLGDYLVVTLAKCGGLEDARQISLTLPHRTVFSWTAMIAAYTDSGQAQEALNMYQLMREDGVEPDNYTFVSVLKACGSIPNLEEGMRLHVDSRRMGFASDIFVGNTLVSMYGKCGAITKAENVFRGLSLHNEVSCNAMLSVYVEQGQGEKALQLYRQMQEERVSPNQLTFAITIQACHILAEKDEALQCAKVIALEIGRALHYDAQRNGFGSDAFVGNMVVSMYGKCGAIAEAETAFSALSLQDIQSCTIMLSVYVEQGQAEKALQFYRQMYLNGMHPDPHMFVTALQACGTLSEKEEASLVERLSTKETSLEIGLALHDDARIEGFTSDVFVATALMTMYGKCGRLLEAESVFSKLSQRSIVSWTAMLSAYVEQDQHAKALYLYRQMQKEFVTLDDVTLICILQACSETGNLEICKHLHFAIVSAGGYGKKISLPATLVHAYSSCASMIDAHVVFDGLAQPDVVSWSACIAGYAGKGSCLASLQMFEAMQQAGIKPNEVTFASVLSACSHTGLVGEGLEYFDSMGRDYCITRELKHYVNMIDLLGRAGDFKKLEDILRRMPVQADLTIWLCLLGMCLRHGNLEMGKWAFDLAVSLQPEEAVAYILMSNIYAETQLGECAGKVEILGQQEDTRE